MIFKILDMFRLFLTSGATDQRVVLVLDACISISMYSISIAYSEIVLVLRYRDNEAIVMCK